MSAIFVLADLREHARTLITDCKVPKNVFVALEIGRNSVGTTDYLAVDAS
jgi:hypothetical protein